MKLDEIIEKYGFQMPFTRDGEDRGIMIKDLNQLRPHLKSDVDELKIELADAILKYWDSFYHSQEIYPLIQQIKEMQG